MRALVTGSAGFVGRHMVAGLIARGFDVDSVDLEPMEVVIDFSRPAHLHVIQDALRYFQVHPVRYDLLVHAAASQPHRAAIDGAPMNLVRNLHLDAAAFDWAVRTGTPMLYLSSCAAYPAGLQTALIHRPLREDDINDRLRDPGDAYGWTKLTGEKMAAAAGRYIPVHVVRPFSGYGEDQDERWPFGAFAARARRREDPFIIWGDGSQVRDWVHISDVVGAALAIVDADVREPVNICTGAGTSMVDLAQQMWAQVGYKPRLELHPARPAGVAYRVGNPTRMQAYYTPKVDLAEGVRRALVQGDGG